MLKGMGKNFQLVFTKCDKMSDSDLSRGLELAQLIQEKYQSMNFYVHFTSSKHMTGIGELRNHIMFQTLSQRLSA